MRRPTSLVSAPPPAAIPFPAPVATPPAPDAAHRWAPGALASRRTSPPRAAWSWPSTTPTHPRRRDDLREHAAQPDARRQLRAAVHGGPQQELEELPEGDGGPSPADPPSRAVPQLVVTHGSGGYMRGGHISNSGIPAGTDAESEAPRDRRFALAARWMEHRFPKRAAGVLTGGGQKCPKPLISQTCPRLAWRPHR